MYGYIYITTNKVNNRKYVGQHKGKFDSRYYGSGLIISQALAKYGVENFEVQMLECCETRLKLNECEKKWISYFNAVEDEQFYNIAKGGEGGHTIAGYNDEQKAIYHKNMRKALKGRKFTDEHKMKISKSLKNASLKRCGENNPFYGKTHSEETKRRIAEKSSRNNLGKKLTEEHKKKISESHKGKIVSKETREKMSKITTARNLGSRHSEETKRRISESNKVKVAIALNEDIIEFDSVCECAEYLKRTFNLSVGTLKLLLRNKNSFEPKQKRHYAAKGLRAYYL